MMNEVQFHKEMKAEQGFDSCIHGVCECVIQPHSWLDSGCHRKQIRSPSFLMLCVAVSLSTEEAGRGARGLVLDSVRLVW